MLHSWKSPLPVGYVPFFLYMTIGIPANTLPSITKNLFEPVLLLHENNRCPSTRKVRGGSREPLSCQLDWGRSWSLVLSAITQHVWDNQVIRPSQHGIMKGKSCLTNFYDKVTHLVDDGKTVDAVDLDFSKPFDCLL